jgi:hypothetical protein
MHLVQCGLRQPALSGGVGLLAAFAAAQRGDAPVSGVAHCGQRTDRHLSEGVPTLYRRVAEHQREPITGRGQLVGDLLVD